MVERLPENCLRDKGRIVQRVRQSIGLAIITLQQRHVVLHCCHTTDRICALSVAVTATIQSPLSLHSVAPTAIPTVRLTSMPVARAGSKTDWMAAAGIPQSDWANVDFIITNESGWRVTVKNPTSPAYGLCQSLPASKMASAGADYLTNPITQLRWCHQYAIERYGGWSGALTWWKSHRWW